MLFSQGKGGEGSGISSGGGSSGGGNDGGVNNRGFSSSGDGGGSDKSSWRQHKWVAVLGAVAVAVGEMSQICSFVLNVGEADQLLICLHFCFAFGSACCEVH